MGTIEAASKDAARRAVGANPAWYHTLELAPGVVTPGHIDLRRTANKVLPRDLRGKRALDVGTFDGFWAFEMERRGADVVAIDLDHLDNSDWPPHQRDTLLREAEEFGVELGRGFRLAAELRGSDVRRVPCNVYDLTPEVIGGQVDVAFMGALLIHLRDPVRALERVRQALAPGGALYLLEVVSMRDTLLSPRQPKARMEVLQTRYNWWRPNAAALRHWLGSAGFSRVKRLGLHRPPQQPPMSEWLLSLRAS